MLLLFGDMVLFFFSNVKRDADALNTLFLLICLFSDYLRVFAVYTVKWKETFEIDSSPILFIFSGTIRMVTVINVKCNSPLKYNIFG